MICKICGFEFNDEKSIENHLRSEHFLSYRDYYEIVKLGKPFIPCWKCGTPRYTISPYLENSELPCSLCSKSDKTPKEIREDIKELILRYEGKIERNRFYQFLLSISDSRRTEILPKSFEVISNILKEIKKRDKIRIEKSTLFDIINDLGVSGEISERNMNNLRMISFESKTKKVSQGCYKIEYDREQYYLYTPEIIPFDYRHHSRHSILNKNSKRKTKRIKLESGECLKLWQTPNPSVWSIFNLRDSSGKSIYFQDIPGEFRFILKNEIFRVKELCSRLFDIYNEIFNYTVYIKDSVILHNSLEMIKHRAKIFKFFFTWDYESMDYNEEDHDLIKLSVL